MANLPFEDRLTESLAERLAEIHQLEAPEEAAAELVTKDTIQFQLMGVRRATGQSVFYDSTLRKIVTAPFDRNGVTDLDKTELSSLSSQPDVDRWVFERESDYWTWLHPRFAWVNE